MMNFKMKGEIAPDASRRRWSDVTAPSPGKLPYPDHGHSTSKTLSSRTKVKVKVKDSENACL
jgi:hypothetical protein